jgi:hypothetical protein
MFKMKNEVGVEFITTVIEHNYNVSFDIYKYKTENCDEKYFDVTTNIKYIGYIDNDIFYIINLIDDTFPEDFKESFNWINKNIIELLLVPLNMVNTLTSDEQNLRSDSRRKLRDIENKYGTFNYIKYEPCKQFIKVDYLNDKLISLNNILNCKDYEIKLNYIFQMKNNTVFTAEMGKITRLLLCIYHNSNCVSSLSITYNDERKQISIDSETNPKYEGKKMNKLLRSVIIMMSKDMFPSADYVHSSAINPTSAYLMIKHFNAMPMNVDLNEVDTYAKIQKYMDKNVGINCRIDLNENNIRNASDVMYYIIENEFDCIKHYQNKRQKIGGKLPKTQKHKKCIRYGKKSKTIRTTKNKKRHKKCK